MKVESVEQFADLERALATFANDGKRHANVTALSQLRATLQRLARNRARHVNGEPGLDHVLPRGSW